MIYATLYCPICRARLEEIITGTIPKVSARYVCNKTVLARNDLDNNSSRRHYCHYKTSVGSLATIVIPPFQIEHLSFERSTTVYACSPWQPKKFIFRCAELDMDWEQPQDVIRRLNLLVTFS